ncbi:phosphate signaling complex protein PhoU [Aminithiophilus ramosus]|uniref:Phosphate-specific transport system accessory protein PhoU n=2 Tax=Synergistales TaxID=649776 RepID=A0A9Q7EYR2_9BACT|nr:phosphate signaling complex protein PhoU [Aminithiophilus ramosus]QTX32306.1 phosphate signaling complex protein PhoU [Aminithiophilus ramosus]QVL36172.1 phosphate signaling complex protein PhoU [Synergistota bacterium]
MDNLNVRQTIDGELEALRRNLLNLANRAGEAVRKALWALCHQDRILAQEVIDSDDDLDSRALKIDEECLLFIARFQPVAQDLRTVSSISHMAIDLERIGDLGVNVAKFALKLSDRPFVKPLIDIPRMGEILQEMIDATMRAFINGDVEEAKKACALDDPIDDLERQIFREMLLMMMENPRIIEEGTALITVARNLERAADHVTNLAERVLYAVTGKVVSASQFRRPKAPRDAAHGR